MRLNIILFFFLHLYALQQAPVITTPHSFQLFYILMKLVLLMQGVQDKSNHRNVEVFLCVKLACNNCTACLDWTWDGLKMMLSSERERVLWWGRGEWDRKNVRSLTIHMKINRNQVEGHKKGNICIICCQKYFVLRGIFLGYCDSRYYFNTKYSTR